MFDAVDFKDEHKLGPNLYEDRFGRLYSHNTLLKGIMQTSKFGDFKKSSSIYSKNDTLNINLDPSLFKRNPNGWNIQAACQWLITHSHASTQHACAKYVRQAIEAGGISTAGRPTWAWKYINYLPTIGFKYMGNFQNGFKGEPGDIAVYMKNGNPNVPGHICMWTGVQWCSDFRQNSMIVYGGTKEAKVFRFES